MRAVIDTSVYVSLLLSQRGTGAWLMALWREQKYRVAISDPIYEELVEVLRRPHISTKVDSHRQRALLRRLQQDAIWTSGTTDTQGSLPDPDDEMLISTALEANADFIVTWDSALHGEHEGVSIVSPDVFISAIVR